MVYIVQPQMEIDSLYSHCMHALAWSKVIFLCCADSLENSPLQNQVIQHHLILQIIT